MRGWPKCTKIAWGQEKPNSKDKPAAPPPAVLWFLWRVCVCVCVCMCTHLVDQSCSTLCDPVNCSLPGFSVCGILQARILEWVAVSSSRGSSRPRDQTLVSYVSCTGRQIIYHYTTWEAFFDLFSSNFKSLCSFGLGGIWIGVHRFFALQPISPASWCPPLSDFILPSPPYRS